jgi:hypothetical protein
LSKRLNLIRVPFPHILLAGSFSGGQCNLPDGAPCNAFAGKIPSNETLLPLILDKDDDLGRPTQAPIRVQPVQPA